MANTTKLVILKLVRIALDSAATQTEIPQRSTCDFSTAEYDFTPKLLDLYGRDPATIMTFCNVYPSFWRKLKYFSQKMLKCISL